VADRTIAEVPARLGGSGSERVVTVLAECIYE
jgi:hypothetical protein